MKKLFEKRSLLFGKCVNFATRSYCKCKAKCSADSGQGVAEYIIILAVIVIACIGLAFLFRDQLSVLWETVTSALEGAADGRAPQ